MKDIFFQKFYFILIFKQGFNALHYAAASGNPYHALVVIFEHATNEVVNGQSVITAMHLAAAQGYDEALAVLLSKVWFLSIFCSIEAPRPN